MYFLLTIFLMICIVSALTDLDNSKKISQSFLQAHEETVNLIKNKLNKNISVKKDKDSNDHDIEGDGFGDNDVLDELSTMEDDDDSDEENKDNDDINQNDEFNDEEKLSPKMDNKDEENNFKDSNNVKNENTKEIQMDNIKHNKNKLENKKENTVKIVNKNTIKINEKKSLENQLQSKIKQIENIDEESIQEKVKNDDNGVYSENDLLDEENEKNFSNVKNQRITNLKKVKEPFNNNRKTDKKKHSKYKNTVFDSIDIPIKGDNTEVIAAPLDTEAEAQEDENISNNIPNQNSSNRNESNDIPESINEQVNEDDSEKNFPESNSQDETKSKEIDNTKQSQDSTRVAKKNKAATDLKEILEKELTTIPPGASRDTPNLRAYTFPDLS